MRGDWINVEIDAAKAINVLKDLTPDAMERAFRRTLRKTGVWIRSQTVRAVGKETMIPLQVLRHRIKFFHIDSTSGKIWIGLTPLLAHRMAYSPARQGKEGVMVGKHRFPGDWLMPVYRKSKEDGAKYQPLWKRKRNGKLLHGKYIVMRRVDKDRFPIEPVTFDWEKSGRAAFERIADLVEERLMVILKQEVNYELQKAIGNAR